MDEIDSYEKEQQFYIEIPRAFIQAMTNYFSEKTEIKEKTEKYILNLLQYQWEQLVLFSAYYISPEYEDNNISDKNRLCSCICLRQALLTTHGLTEEKLFDDWTDIPINIRNFIKKTLLFNLSCPDESIRHIVSYVIARIAQIEENKPYSLIITLSDSLTNFQNDYLTIEGSISTLKELFELINFKLFFDISDPNSLSSKDMKKSPESEENIFSELLNNLLHLSKPYPDEDEGTDNNNSGKASDIRIFNSIREISGQTAYLLVQKIPCILKQEDFQLEDFIEMIVDSFVGANLSLYTNLISLLTLSFENYYENTAFIQDSFSLFIHGIEITSESFLYQTILSLNEFAEFELKYSMNPSNSDDFKINIFGNNSNILCDLLLPLFLEISEENYDLEDPSNTTPTSLAFETLSLLFLANPPDTFRKIVDFVHLNIDSKQSEQQYGALTVLLCLCKRKGNQNVHEISKEDEGVHLIFNELFGQIIEISKTEIIPLRFISLYNLSVITEICSEITQKSAEFGDILDSICGDFDTSNQKILLLQCKILYNLIKFGSDESISSTFDIIGENLNRRAENNQDLFATRDIYEALSALYYRCDHDFDQKLSEILPSLIDEIQKDSISYIRLAGLISNIGQICFKLDLKIMPYFNNIVSALIASLSKDDQDIHYEVFTALSYIFRIYFTSKKLNYKIFEKVTSFNSVNSEDIENIENGNININIPEDQTNMEEKPAHYKFSWNPPMKNTKSSQQKVKISNNSPGVYFNLINTHILHALKSNDHLLIKSVTRLLEIMIESNLESIPKQDAESLFNSLIEMVDERSHSILEEASRYKDEDEKNKNCRIEKMDSYLIRNLAILGKCSHDNFVHFYSFFRNLGELWVFSPENIEISILMAYRIIFRADEIYHVNITKEIGFYFFSYIEKLFRKDIYNESIFHYMIIDLFEIANRAGDYFIDQLRRKYISSIIDIAISLSNKTISQNALTLQKFLKTFEM